MGQKELGMTDRVDVKTEKRFGTKRKNVNGLTGWHIKSLFQTIDALDRYNQYQEI